MESMAMDEGRLARIVGQVNALHPDLVVLAGDFIEGRGAGEAERAIPLLARPLSQLKAPLGVVAVRRQSRSLGPIPHRSRRCLRRIGGTRAGQSG